jgi:ElaB/YqjD/DUF883 family membrane-anchored ribosome-binding protein
MPDEHMSAREAVEKAFAETMAVDEAPEALPAEVGEEHFEQTDDLPDTRERDEFGRFKARSDEVVTADTTPAEAPKAPQVEQPRFDPPSRFSADAKAAWDNAPLPIKAEINRAFKELEGGIERYRAEVEPFRPFLERARQTGSDPVVALSNYISIEDRLRENPIGGLEQICRNMGTDLRSVAAHVMGQPAPDANEEIAALRQEVQQLRGHSQELQTYKQRQEQERTQQTTKQVEEFWAAHPRAEELANVIQWALKTGLAADLPTAYQYAERLHPAPATAAAPQPGTAPTGQPQKQGPVSIKGAPSAGSNPGRGSTSMSTREAAAQAYAQVFGR